MTTDVDAERLNGLVNLLHVVGIDDVDPNALVEEQKRLAGQTKGDDANGAAASLSSDQQILEIIKKLQQAQADSPEILAALKSPELRALASLAAQKQGAPAPSSSARPSPARSSSSRSASSRSLSSKGKTPQQRSSPAARAPASSRELSSKGRAPQKSSTSRAASSRELSSKARAPPPRAKSPEPEPEPEPEEPSFDEIMDDDDNYPKIGPGYSDDISVVSDLTTPTVMTRGHIQDEEHYKDLNGGAGNLPPMNIALGGGPAPPARPPMTIGGGHSAMAAPKKRNLVSAVQPGALRSIAKPGGSGGGAGGAAAQRRLNYQQAMAKLQSTGDYPSEKSQDKSYMDSFSPKRAPKASVTAPTTPAPDPSEFFPSIAENKKARPRKAAPAKGRAKKNNLSLASQEVQNSGDSRPASSKKTGSKDDFNGWPAFDGDDSKKSKKDTFGKDDAFFGTPSFGAAGGRDGVKSPTKSPRKKGKEEKRFAEIKITRDDGQGTKKSSTTKDKKEKEKVPKPKKTSRRASLSM